MGKIPGVNHLAAIRALEKAGFAIVRQGKHIIMSDGVRILAIPRNNPINALTMGGNRSGTRARCGRCRPSLGVTPDDSTEPIRSMSRFPIREATDSDMDSLFDIRARTRENAISRTYLESIGITAESWSASIRSGNQQTWVCTDGATPVAFCGADATTGELVVLAVLPDYEGLGLGKRLLSHAVEWLRSRGWRRLWLATNPDPTVRSHGFYRSQGWRPTGERQERAGDEILVLE